MSPTRTFREDPVIQMLLPVQRLDIQQLDTFLDEKIKQDVLETSKEVFEVGDELLIIDVANRNFLPGSYWPLEICISRPMTQSPKDRRDNVEGTSQFAQANGLSIEAQVVA